MNSKDRDDTLLPSPPYPPIDFQREKSKKDTKRSYNLPSLFDCMANPTYSILFRLAILYVEVTNHPAHRTWRLRGLKR